MNFIHHLPATSLRHGHCRHCNQAILFAPRVGWIEPYPGLSYDACAANDFGRHEPDPESVPDPYWKSSDS